MIRDVNDNKKKKVDEILSIVKVSSIIKNSVIEYRLYNSTTSAYISFALRIIILFPQKA